MSRRIIYFFGVLTLVFSIFLYTKFVYAATRTWDGGGATNNWSECANWSSNTCPTTADTVTFSSTSTKDATIDAGFTTGVLVLNINAGYTGTITQARSFAVGGSMTVASGTFNAADQTFTNLTSVTISGGTFTASSGTTTLHLLFHTSGTFNHNNGTVIMASTVSNTALNLTTQPRHRAHSTLEQAEHDVVLIFLGGGRVVGICGHLEYGFRP